MTFHFASPAFEPGQTIPRKYTCDGEDLSPPLTWTGAPSGTCALALICDDPDAPGKTWVHWVLYGIPADVSELPEGASNHARLPRGAKEGMNDFNRSAYGGPCPPPGKPHRYYFRLYALSQEVGGLATGAGKRELLDAMRGKILSEAQVMGTYVRGHTSR